jgi:hypothetical protein
MFLGCAVYLRTEKASCIPSVSICLGAILYLVCCSQIVDIFGDFSESFQLLCDREPNPMRGRTWFEFPNVTEIPSATCFRGEHFRLINTIRYFQQGIHSPATRTKLHNNRHSI